MAADWFPDWSGEICAVVASGESATPEAVEQLRDKARVIVVNNNYKLAPWADALYAADGKWWDVYREARHFAWLKITEDAATAKRLGIHRVRVVAECDPLEHTIQYGQRGLLGRGGHSGFQALNLAVQFRAKRILLVGFDLCRLHWHDQHPAPLKNPSQRTLAKWCGRLDAQAPIFEALEIDVVNASLNSALTAFPKMTIKAALQRWSVDVDLGKSVGFNGEARSNAVV